MASAPLRVFIPAYLATLLLLSNLVVNAPIKYTFSEYKPNPTRLVSETIWDFSKSPKNTLGFTLVPSASNSVIVIPRGFKKEVVLSEELTPIIKAPSAPMSIKLTKFP